MWGWEGRVMPENLSENDRLRELVVGLADRAGLDDEHKRALDIAASLLGVGRLPLADILEKKGALSPEEVARIRDLPKIWSDFAEQLSPLKALGVPQIVETYCERWDGSGYPKGLAGEEIPLGARVLAVCYHYNGMISERPYREPMPRDRAAAEIRGMSGKILDPGLVETFVEMIEEKHRSARPAVGSEERPVPAKRSPEKRPAREKGRANRKSKKKPKKKATKKARKGRS